MIRDFRGSPLRANMMPSSALLESYPRHCDGHGAPPTPCSQEEVSGKSAVAMSRNRIHSETARITTQRRSLTIHHPTTTKGLSVDVTRRRLPQLFSLLVARLDSLAQQEPGRTRVNSTERFPGVMGCCTTCSEDGWLR